MQVENTVAHTTHTLPTGANSGKDAKLQHSAHEFEASLMAELLKPLQESDGLTGESDDGGGGTGSGGALASFASESLARAISDRGGFGIAERILHQFATTKAAAQKGAGDQAGEA